MKRVDVGEGSPRALLVHGNGLAPEFYLPLAEALADHHVSTRLIMLPGFGGEPPLPDPGWKGLVDEVLGVLPERCALLGHSMGGLVALLAAARRPEGLSELALLEPAVFPTRWLARAAARRYTRAPLEFRNWNGGQWRVADAERYPADKIELFVQTRAAGDRATVDALFAGLADLYPLPFDRVDVPTLLVTGAASGWRARVLTAMLRRRLPAHEHVVMPDAAHWLANEHDARLARVIAGFLR